MKREPLRELRDRLRAAALEHGSSPRDVDVVLSDTLGQSHAWLLAHGDQLVDPEPVIVLLERRFRGEPLQYIRGRTEFYSREFVVDSRVLIPRPETETLVETALSLARPAMRVADIGTGSGCIAISMERSRPDLRVIGVDLSVEALAVAELNRRRLSSQVALIASNLLRSIRGTIDLVVSNPPYIPTAVVESLAREVRDFEPRMALTPGAEGTEIIERILEESRSVLVPRGKVILEIGFGQTDEVATIAAACGFVVEKVIPDLAAIERVVVLSAGDAE